MPEGRYNLPTIEDLGTPEKIFNDLSNLLATYNGWEIEELHLELKKDAYEICVIMANGLEVHRIVR